MDHPVNFAVLVSATMPIPVSDADELSVRFSTSPGVIRQVLGEMTVEGSTSINQGLNNDDHVVGEAGDGHKENCNPSQHGVLNVGQKKEIAELKFKRSFREVVIEGKNRKKLYK